MYNKNYRSARRFRTKKKDGLKNMILMASVHMPTRELNGLVMKTQIHFKSKWIGSNQRVMLEVILTVIYWLFQDFNIFFSNHSDDLGCRYG
jgi:hypothetical protein